MCDVSAQQPFCLCSDCQPCSAAYSYNFVFYTVTGSRRERWDTLHCVPHSLGLDVKYENLCPSFLFEQRTFFLIKCLCPNLPLRSCRADSRLEDSGFLSSLGVWALYPRCWGEKQAREYVLGSFLLQSVCAISKCLSLQVRVIAKEIV